MKIRRIIIDEVVVRAKPDSINSPEVDKPLHMLPHGGRAAWSVQFDEIPKLIVRLEVQGGIVGRFCNVAVQSVHGAVVVPAIVVALGIGEWSLRHAQGSAK